MDGTDRVRHCQQCGRNVYNLSAMSRHEAEVLMAGAGPLRCVRFYRRRDGTIITDDCPVGKRSIKRRDVLLAASLLMTTAPIFVLGFYAWLLSPFEPPGDTTLLEYLHRHEPFATACELFSPRTCARTPLATPPAKLPAVLIMGQADI
jgi:hypothetical protein